jgi:hypothetical protein
MKLLRSFFVLLLITPLVMASPGAHGPNGEHLDAPGGHVHTDAGPRIDTFTELFELVGHLQEGELSVLIDSYETNEPILNGKLEVEFNGLKTPAKFHADHGDYAIDDEQFLKALSKPGKHALVFTLTAGEESDLLEGTLNVEAHEQDNAHGHVDWQWAIAALVAVAIVVAAVLGLRRRKPFSGKQ